MSNAQTLKRYSTVSQSVSPSINQSSTRYIDTRHKKYHTLSTVPSPAHSASQLQNLPAPFGTSSVPAVAREFPPSSTNLHPVSRSFFPTISYISFPPSPTPNPQPFFFSPTSLSLPFHTTHPLPRFPNIEIYHSDWPSSLLLPDHANFADYAELNPGLIPLASEAPQPTDIARPADQLVKSVSQSVYTHAVPRQNNEQRLPPRRNELSCQAGRQFFLPHHILHSIIRDSLFVFPRTSPSKWLRDSLNASSPRSTSGASSSATLVAATDAQPLSPTPSMSMESTFIRLPTPLARPTTRTRPPTRVPAHHPHTRRLSAQQQQHNPPRPQRSARS